MGGPNISKLMFKGGVALFAFDLSHDLWADLGHVYAKRTGNLGVELTFREPLPDPVTLVVYQEHDAMLEVDAFRNVVLV